MENIGRWAVNGESEMSIDIFQRIKNLRGSATASSYMPAMLIALLAVGLGLVTRNPWSLLPLPPLGVMMLVRSWPSWARAPVMRLARAALYASFGVCLFVGLDTMLGTWVTPWWYRAAENAILDARGILEAAANPFVMVPLIIVFGAISFIRADAHLMKRFARLADVLGTISLTIYTLSLFTLFTSVQANNKLEDLIDKYQLAIEAERKAVGDYLARKAVTETLKEHKDALVVLLQELGGLHQRCAQLRALLPPLRDLSETEVANRVRKRLKEQLPHPSEVDLELPPPADAAPHTALQYREYTLQARQNEFVAKNRIDALNTALSTGLSTIFGASGLDEYLSSALADLSDTLYETYLAPQLETRGSENQLLLDPPHLKFWDRDLNNISAFRTIDGKLKETISVLRWVPAQERTEWIRDHLPGIWEPGGTQPPKRDPAQVSPKIKGL
jgi:hypothetical protein